MDLYEVRTVEQCIDLATTHAYGDDELTSSWENCLTEMFEGVEAELASQTVKVIGFTALAGAVLAICRWKKNKLRVTLDSLEFKSLNTAQKLWLRAYLKWQRQGWGHYA